MSPDLDDDVRPLGAIHGIFVGLVLTVLVGGLLACVAVALIGGMR